jgi:hypothetical protein
VIIVVQVLVSFQVLQAQTQLNFPACLTFLANSIRTSSLQPTAVSTSTCCYWTGARDITEHMVRMESHAARLFCQSGPRTRSLKQLSNLPALIQASVTWSAQHTLSGPQPMWKEGRRRQILRGK